MQQGTALQQPVAPAVGQPRLHSQMDAAQMQQMQMQQMQQMMQQQQAANMAGMQVPGMQFQMPAVGYGGLAPGQYGLQVYPRENLTQKSLSPFTPFPLGRRRFSPLSLQSQRLCCRIFRSARGK